MRAPLTSVMKVRASRDAPLLLMAVLTLLCLVPSQQSAAADKPGGGEEALCSKFMKRCFAAAQSEDVTGPLVLVTEKDSPGTGKAVVPQRISKRDVCETQRLVPQPPHSDPVWRGNSTGAIYVQGCPFTKDAEPLTTVFWAPGEEAAEIELVDPIVLALQARDGLRLPRPQGRRSPSGQTFVNEYTWFWLPGGWKDLTATARAGAVWATVTAKPREMRVSAGGDVGGTTCSGPGRAWTPTDGAGAPSDGGCALVFKASGTFDVNVAVPYDVSWTGSGGAGGDLGVITAEGQDAVTVLEAVSVSRS
ncbi:hypothetical protein Kisp01_69650 [Kineosporia sp. NBRC 101677]|nr:hypothetical protein Kisp01_69650 [Kineosporia sp. NBRC 101677]